MFFPFKLLIALFVIVYFLSACGESNDVATIKVSNSSLAFIAEKGGSRPSGEEVIIEANQDMFFVVDINGGGAIEKDDQEDDSAIITILSSRSASLFVEAPLPTRAFDYVGSIIVYGCKIDEDPCMSDNILDRVTIEVAYRVTGIYTTATNATGQYYNDEFKYDELGVYKQFNVNNTGVLNFKLRDLPGDSVGWSTTINYTSSIANYDNVRWLTLSADNGTTIPTDITATIRGNAINSSILSDQPTFTAEIVFTTDTGKTTDFMVTLSYKVRPN